MVFGVRNIHRAQGEHDVSFNLNIARKPNMYLFKNINAFENNDFT